MRLLYTITAYPPSIGGAQILQHQLARQLQHRGHDVQVVSHWDTVRTDWLLGTTLKAPGDSRDYTVDGVPVHRMGFSVTDRLMMLPFVPLYYPVMDMALPPIARIIQRKVEPYASGVDVVHNTRIGREGLSEASFNLARSRNSSFVLTPVHHPRWVGWRYRAYNRLYRRADAVIALTEAEKATLVNLGVEEERIHVTGMGPWLADQADPQAFLSQYELSEPIVLFVGQSYPYKGYQQLLEATALVWKRVPEAQFVFIGPPVMNSDEVFRQYPDPRIHRLGQVSLEDKTNALAACTVFCMPSTQESFGGVYTEAWTFAKPVIGCPIPAVKEVIDDEVNGYLVEQTPQAIADRIIDLLLNPARARAMGQAGQDKVNQRYSWPVLAERTEAIYHSVIR